MSIRYVVLVKPPDDHPGFVKIMGTFSDRARAEALCEKVRAACTGVDMDEDSPGFAYVLRVRAPRVREAVRWAQRGEE